MTAAGPDRTSRITTFVGRGRVRLQAQAFGRPEDEAILLIAGATNCMHWWADDFCLVIANAGRFVVRYDHRDTGSSSRCDPGAPDYGFDDIVGDAEAVASAFELHKPHLVGISMGGAVVQRIAVGTPGMAASLTLMSTSPGSAPGRAIYPDLPPVSQRLRAAFATQSPEQDFARVIVSAQHLLSGSVAPSDAELREIAELVAAEPAGRAALTTHPGLNPGAEYRTHLPRVATRTLVVHGTEDPLYPFGHAEALAAEIPEATLLPLDGVGHQYPPRPTWPVLIPRLLTHTSGPPSGLPQKETPGILPNVTALRSLTADSEPACRPGQPSGFGGGWPGSRLQAGARTTIKPA